MKRNSSIEILRILTMFFIFSGHFYGQSDLSSIYTGGGIAVSLLTSGSRIAVNVFIYITCYFMADKNYKVSGSKITGTYFMLWFYSVILGFATLIINKSFSYGIIKAFFPFLGGALWYMTMYIAFLLLFPFVSRVNCLDRDKHKILSIICFIIFPIYSSLHRFPEGMLAYYGWIVVCYIWLSYYRKYLEVKIKTQYIEITTLIGVMVYFVLVWMTAYNKNGTLVSYAYYYLTEMTTLPNVLMSLPLVLLSTRINIGNRKWINNIAGCMGAVYIAHQIQAFYPTLWKLICIALKFILPNVSIIPVLFIVFIVFTAIVFFIEKIRILLWKNFEHTSFIRKLDNLIGLS